MTQTNRFAPPKAEVVDISDRPAPFDIESISVSSSWKQKFRLIEKAGGPKQPDLKTLSLFVACVAVIVVIGFGLDLAGLSKVANALGYGAAAIFAVRANIDYYKKMVLGEKGWW